jgi:hypothetical protein
MVSKGRSPRYPRISLGDAIGYARRLYDEGHRAKVDADTAARLMGFSGKSGASAIALGALRQYGLVDGLRGDMQISDLAMRILQPMSRDEEDEAKLEAAFQPDVFDALSAHFDGEFPKSDEPIKAHLIRSMGFSQIGAGECVSSLRKTLEDIERSSFQSVGRTLPVSSELIAASLDQDAQESYASPEHRPTVQAPDIQSELVRIPLSKSCTAELRLLGEIDQAAIDRLVQYIELMRGVWAE